jgi:hypothetical protein
MTSAYERGQNAARHVHRVTLDELPRNDDAEHRHLRLRRLGAGKHTQAVLLILPALNGANGAMGSVTNRSHPQGVRQANGECY